MVSGECLVRLMAVRLVQCVLHSGGQITAEPYDEKKPLVAAVATHHSLLTTHLRRLFTIRVNNILHEPVSYHVFIRELDKSDSIHAAEDADGFFQSGPLIGGQVYLGGVAGDDHF